MERYCDCDMICDIGGKDDFYIIILIFIEKHMKMILVWFLQECFLKLNDDVRARTTLQHHNI